MQRILRLALNDDAYIEVTSPTGDPEAPEVRDARGRVHNARGIMITVGWGESSQGIVLNPIVAAQLAQELLNFYDKRN